MKKVLLLAAIALATSFAASANPECNPWAATSETPVEAPVNSTSKTDGCQTSKANKKADNDRQTSAKLRRDNIHIRAHQQAISNQHIQK